MTRLDQTQQLNLVTIFMHWLAHNKVFTHIITLLNRQTDDEVTLHIETTSDRFIDVLLEITHQKAIRKLFGYEIFEVLDCNDPF